MHSDSPVKPIFIEELMRAQRRLERLGKLLRVTQVTRDSSMSPQPLAPTISTTSARGRLCSEHPGKSGGSARARVRPVGTGVPGASLLEVGVHAELGGTQDLGWGEKERTFWKEKGRTFRAEAVQSCGKCTLWGLRLCPFIFLSVKWEQYN